MGYPVPIQYLVNGLRSLQDCRLLKDYSIKQEMTITLNLWLRGGAAQSIPRSAEGDKRNMPNSQQQANRGPSYRNILQGKKAVGSPPDQAGNTPRPYIV